MVCGWEGAEEEREENTAKCSPRVVREEPHSRTNGHPHLSPHIPALLPFCPSVRKRIIKTMKLEVFAYYANKRQSNTKKYF